MSGQDAQQKKIKAYRKGRWAEILACLYMVIKGYRPLAWRFKTHCGEIDLIMKRGEYIVFTEVKARQNLDAALEAVSTKARNRIQNAAMLFIQKYKRYQNHALRFDVIAVHSAFRMKHIDNAWQADL